MTAQQMRALVALTRGAIDAGPMPAAKGLELKRALDAIGSVTREAVQLSPEDLRLRNRDLEDRFQAAHETITTLLLDHAQATRQ